MPEESGHAQEDKNERIRQRVLAANSYEGPSLGGRSRGPDGVPRAHGDRRRAGPTPPAVIPTPHPATNDLRSVRCVLLLAAMAALGGVTRSGCVGGS